MKNKLIALLTFLLIAGILNAQSYDVVNYNFNGTPVNGIKIKTNIPYLNGSQMPTLHVEGYNYGTGQTIGLNIVWYIYAGSFINYSISSFGAYTPKVYLANEAGKVVIFIEDKPYYQRFKVTTFAQGMSEVNTWFQGWTTADELVTGTNKVELAYQNAVGKLRIADGTQANGKVLMSDAAGLASWQTVASEVNNYTPILYNFNGTPVNGIKIKTNIPYLDGSQMPNVHIEGYNFGTGQTIGLNIVWYIYGGSFINYSISSFGAYTPKVYLANEAGKVVIFIEDKPYYQRFKVTAFAQGMSEVNTWFQGWTTVDELVTGINKVELPYQNNFGMVKIGNVATSGNYKLFVEQGILTEKVKVAVKSSANWSDFVFNPNYNLKPLSEVEGFIKTNKHLPGVPSAKAMVTNGLDVAAMDAKLLEKIEELTLYIIEMKKETDVLKKQIKLILNK